MGPKKRSLTQQPSKSSGQSSKTMRISNTQPSVADSFRVTSITNEELNDLANECVRFMVFRAGNQLPFRKSDLTKNIKGTGGKILDKVLDIASTTLEQVYGYKLVLCDGATKFYILTNKLPYIEEDEETDELPSDRKKILLMLVLLHIFMSKINVPQASLYSFLRTLHIDTESRHEIFGDVKEYINTTLVKQHYLTIVKDAISQEITYTWGERAEKEISKMDLLEYVCKVYKSSNPKAWVTQFKEAKEQPIPSHRNSNTEAEDEEMDL